MRRRRLARKGNRLAAAVLAAVLACLAWAGMAEAQTSPATWPTYFNGTTQMGPYAWIDGPAYYRKDPALSAAIWAGQVGSTKLYVCRASRQDGIHPGKFFNGQCNIGWGGQEVALGSNFQLLINLRPELAPYLRRDWPGRAQLGSAVPFVGGSVGSKQIPVCRGSYGPGLQPGKEWDGKCLIGYGGKEVPGDWYQVLVLSFDKAAWQAAQPPAPPTGPPVLVLLKTAGLCLKADGSNKLPLAPCHTVGTEWVYQNGLLRPHRYPQVCLLHVYDRTNGTTQIKATTDCKNVDTPQMAGNAIFFLEKNAAGLARFRFVSKLVTNGALLELCLLPTGDARGSYAYSEYCSKGDMYKWELPVIPAPKYEAMRDVSAVWNGQACLGAQGVARNLDARNGTNLGLLSWQDCPKDHPLKNFIKEMAPDGKTFRLRFAGTNLCMDIKDGVVYKPGSNVHLWTCHGLASQKWYQVGSQVRSAVGPGTQQSGGLTTMINPTSVPTDPTLCLQSFGSNVQVNTCQNHEYFNFSLSTTHLETYVQVP